MKVALDFIVDFPSLKYNEIITKARQILRDDVYREVYVHDGKRRLMGYIDITDVLHVTATKSNVTVEGYLKEISPVSPDDTVDTVVQRIRQYKTDSVPVTDTHNIIMGGILLSEIFPVVITRKKLQGRVSDFMSAKVVTCAADDPVQKILNLVRDSGFSAFPVVKKSRLVGIISRRDLLRDGRWRISPESSTTPVESVMTTPVISINPDEDINAAAGLMVKHDISRLPVIYEKRIEGIIDRHDVLKCLS